jgi:hypothetical protein
LKRFTAPVTALLIPLLCTLFLLQTRQDLNRVPGDVIAGLERGETERGPDIAQVFLLQRLAGNPGVSIELRTMQEFLKLQASGRNALTKTAAAATWNEEGPWNVAGRMRGLAVHPTDPNTLIAAAASGGLWKSNDQGITWTAVGDTMPIMPYGAVVIDQNNPQRVFAAMGEPVIVQSYPRFNASPVYYRSLGVYRSDDGGTQWRLMPWTSGTLENRAAHRIALHPASSDTLLVATINGLWKSTNGGAAWSSSLSGVMTDVAYKPGQPSRVYCAFGNDDGASNNGVYVSDAGGKSYSWRKLTTNFPAPDSCGRIVLAVTPANPNRIYAAVSLARSKANPITSDFLVVMVSTNGGDSWERKRGAISASFCNGQAYYDLTMAASPADENLVFLGGVDLYRSTNGGYTFTRVADGNKEWNEAGYAHHDHHALAFTSTGNAVFTGNDGGVSISFDRGGTWQRRLGRMGTIQFYACGYDASNPTQYYGGTQDNGSLGKTSADNEQWFEVFGGDGANVAVDPASSTTRFVVSTTATGRPIYRVMSGVVKALSKGLGTGGNEDNFNWIPPLQFHPTDRTRLYTATQYVYQMRSPTGTDPSWSCISPDLGNTYWVVTDLSVSQADQNTMYACTSGARVWVTRNLTSVDVTWTMVSTGLPARWFSDISADWDDPATAYLAVSGFGTGHVWKTTNAGVSWTDISGDLPDIPAGAVVRSRTDVNTLFVANDLGVWVTENGGTNWKRYGAGLPNVIAYDMKLTQDNRLVCGTWGRGIWTNSAVLGIEREPAADAGDFELLDAAPNPAPSHAVLRLSARRAQQMTLRVFSADGRAVRTVMSGTVEPGTSSWRIDTGTLPAGMYFCVADGGGRRSVRKLMVVR